MSEAQLFILCVITSAAIGAFVGLMVAASLAATIVKRWLPEFPEFIAVSSIDMSMSIKEEITPSDEETKVSGKVSVRANAVSADFVERWLERRNLVMSPKGKDFATPVKKGGA